MKNLFKNFLDLITAIAFITTVMASFVVAIVSFYYGFKDGDNVLINRGFITLIGANVLLKGE